MRITKISVKGLFGMFDHEIPLNQDSRITIIHGPNGVGKTRLLEMVHGLFSYRNQYISQTLFDQFRVEFDSGENITLQKVHETDNVSITYDAGAGAGIIHFSLDGSFEEAVLEMRPWVLMKTLFYGTRRLQSDTGPEEFDLWKEITRKPYYLSQTARLAKGSKAGILLATRELTAASLAKMSLWGLLSACVLSMLATATILLTPLAILADIANWILYSVFVAVGNAILPVYDRTKLTREEPRYAVESRSENSLERRRLFEEIVNRRLLFAYLKYDEGSTFNDDYKLFAIDGDEIFRQDLSSGEKHLLTLYYHLTFTAQADSLILIDEPELSLHVTWQRAFLEDLKGIVELRNIDILIATHSPQIVDDKWDWMVPLGKTEEDQV